MQIWNEHGPLFRLIVESTNGTGVFSHDAGLPIQKEQFRMEHPKTASAGNCQTIPPGMAAASIAFEKHSG